MSLPKNSPYVITPGGIYLPVAGIPYADGAAIDTNPIAPSPPYPPTAIRFPANPNPPLALASFFNAYAGACTILAITVSWSTGAGANTFLQIHDTAGAPNAGTRVNTIAQLAPGGGAFAYSQAAYPITTGVTIASSSVEIGYAAGPAFMQMIEVWVLPP